MRMTAILIGLILAISQPAFADWQRITAKADLQKVAVGKSWVNPKNGAWFRLRRNGKLAGAVGKDKLEGAWAWKGNFLCFDRTLGGKAVPSDCVVVQYDGKNIATVRKQGRGSRAEYIRKQLRIEKAVREGHRTAFLARGPGWNRPWARVCSEGAPLPLSNSM